MVWMQSGSLCNKYRNFLWRREKVWETHACTRGEKRRGGLQYHLHVENVHSVKTKKITGMLRVRCIGSNQPTSERSRSQIILLWLLCFTHFQNKECSQTISLSYLITNDRYCEGFHLVLKQPWATKDSPKTSHKKFIVSSFAFQFDHL